ncbi:procollagen-lysine,2-oxoglutarate 5-dioxygenase isoform X2 [Onthophagus taurus]|uniref:procollagen-lysine,2-oxoglutarate 5-dioxygenase isoform X2 n=1 Tax=Onthophagus taurus TaxID=166361 RepID=UPI0039BE3D22
MGLLIMKLNSIMLFLVLIVKFVPLINCSKNSDNVLVFTVATSETDGLNRYLQSAHEYNIKPILLGYGKEWQGGDVKRKPGGGWKVNLLKEALKDLNKDENKERIVIFTDAYDVMFLSGLKTIVEAFKKTEAKVLFSAESFCWPDKSLAEKYPTVTKGKPYLNSGMYMGYIKEIMMLLERKDIENMDDDQLFFTEAYLDDELREKLSMKLDHESEMFQNLNGAMSEVEIRNDKENKMTLRNVVSHTNPLIVHGNGYSKIKLNQLGNYLSNSWDAEEGCQYCKSGQIDLDLNKIEELPIVLLSVFIEFPTPFLEEQLAKIARIEYPKSKIHLFIHNKEKYHKDHVEAFLSKHLTEYLSVKEIKPEDSITESTARDISMDQCLLRNCDVYFSVDSVAHIDNPYTLKLLIEQNRTVVAPLLVRPGKAWSNFWGALTTDGFYARSDDYMDIVHNKKRGLWNVPFINNAYLINATLLRKHDRTTLNFGGKIDKWDPDMAFCGNLRELDVFMFVSNRLEFGHLVDPDTYNTKVTAPDMYQIFENPTDWEARYIHENYTESFDPDRKAMQPCPDVYWFPIVSLNFTRDLISMMENFNQWSDGSNKDSRLEGGYEAVPTRDIHMNQVGWERHWLHFLHQYVRPLQEHIFTGYFHDPPRSLMNFVVRYRPDEQPSLRPHHDSSTYTINIALNERGVDYEGGGCRFIRYNCSVVDTKPGWMLMHPGRLTHYHEGLLVTKGTRYIMIAFVDP